MCGIGPDSVPIRTARFVVVPYGVDLGSRILRLFEETLCSWLVEFLIVSASAGQQVLCWHRREHQYSCCLL